MIRQIRRFIVWTSGSLVVLLAALVLVRSHLSTVDFGLNMLVLTSVILPFLIGGGLLFVRHTLQQERALHWQQARHWLRARRDALVWANNRTAFGEIVQKLQRHLPGQRAGLFLLDLHDFQRINDACGHSVGDELLRETGKRLRQVLHRYSASRAQSRIERHRLLRPRLVRVGSDEFACWLPAWSEADRPDELARAMLECLDIHFSVGSMRLNLKGNVGFLIGSLDDPGLHRGQEWLTRVNAAVQQAKARGAGQIVAFAQEHLAAMVRRHEIHQALVQALTKDQGLSLHYQPIVSVLNSELMGCEALMRWQHPDWGAVSPVEFIPVAEASDLIRPMGRWVLNRGISQLAQWRSDPELPGAQQLRLSINLSRAQLLDPELVTFVQETLTLHDVPPKALCLEVTESLPLEDITCVQMLKDLHEAGITLALDDFGTGYSSLSALLNLPLDSVKIDRQFISGIDNCVHRQSLVAAVLRVAQGMQLNVVAEGIETTAEAETLLSLGCHHMQGWLISKALHADDFTAQWLQRASAPADSPEIPIIDSFCNASACNHARFGRCPAVIPLAGTAEHGAPHFSGA